MVVTEQLRRQWCRQNNGDDDSSGEMVETMAKQWRQQQNYGDDDETTEMRAMK